MVELFAATLHCQFVNTCTDNDESHHDETVELILIYAKIGVMIIIIVHFILYSKALTQAGVD